MQAFTVFLECVQGNRSHTGCREPRRQYASTTLTEPRAQTGREHTGTQIAMPPGRKYKSHKNQSKPPTSRQMGWEVRGGQNNFLSVGSPEGSGAMAMWKMILTGWNDSSWEICLPNTGNSDISYTCGKVWGFCRGKKKKQAGQVYKRMAGEFPGEHPRAWIGVNGIHEMFFEKRRQWATGDASTMTQI